MVPVMENYRLQSYLIDFNGIKQLSESAGLDCLDATVVVAEQDGIDPSQACIVIDEADLILNSDLVDVGIPMVVRPISEQSLVYIVCEELAEEYLETEDEILLEDLFAAFGSSKDTSEYKRNAESQMAIAKSIKRHLAKNRNYSDSHVNMLRAEQRRREESAEAYKEQERLQRQRIKKKEEEEAKKRRQEEKEEYRKEVLENEMKQRKIAEKERDQAQSDLQKHQDSLIGKFVIDKKKAMMTAGGTLAAAIGGGLGYLGIKRYRDQPKSVIAKKIASLRSIYQKWMAKAQSSKDSGIAAKLRRGAAKILQMIDKLLAFLQQKAG
jgi:flagellar biosynthesis GTPase FlhF